MPDALQRIQFRTILKCARCGAEGHALWEENSSMTAAGPMGRLVSLSEGFFEKAGQVAADIPVIACTGCGALQPD
jgi:hypothetical protein